MRFLKLGLISALALFTTQVNAASPGAYISGAAGLTLYSDADVTADGGGSAEYETNAGFGLAVAGGYEFGNGARAELELGFRRNSSDKIDGAGIGGAASAFTIMANGAYDFNMGQWVPYVGGGIGLNILSIEATDGGTTLMDDTGIGFAYQIMGGVGYRVTPQVLVSLDYRLLGSTDVELTEETVGADVDVEYITHSFMIGTRYKF